MTKSLMPQSSWRPGQLEEEWELGETLLTEIWYAHDGLPQWYGNRLRKIKCTHFFFFNSFIHSHVRTLFGSFLPLSPAPGLSHFPLASRQNLFCPYL
jgi:hypothetical protein